jgi:molybdopterin/thiamine biosynthesis adenylyltransferase
VELHKLQRLILPETCDVGLPKVESGKWILESLNPGVRIETYSERITAANIREIIKGYDFLLDGSDNFPTRFLLAPEGTQSR